MVCKMPRGSFVLWRLGEMRDGVLGVSRKALWETVFEQTEKVYIFLSSGHDSPVQISPFGIVKSHQNPQAHSLLPLHSHK